MSVILPHGSRIHLKDPAGYAEIAEKIRAREPIVVTVTTKGVTTQRTLWHPDDPVRLRVPQFYVPTKRPSLLSKFGWKILAAVAALSLLAFTAVTAFAQDSCSSRKAACDNVCWQRSGSAQIECSEYCKRQMASCLKTGVFKTRGGDYSGLQKK
jgi:hypothetical protein